MKYNEVDKIWQIAVMLNAVPYSDVAGIFYCQNIRDTKHGCCGL